MKRYLSLLILLLTFSIPSNAMAQAIIVPSPVPACSNGDVLVWNTASGNFVCTTVAASSQPLSDAFGIVKNSINTTKVLSFNLTGIASATTRTWTIPDANITFPTTIAQTGGTNTFTGLQTFNGGFATTTGTFSSTLTLSGGLSTSTGLFSSTLAAAGDFAINTNKFNVTASNGNTSVAGTFGVTGASSIGGAENVVGNFTVNTNKFSANATTGNVSIAGTLGVVGNITAPILSGDVTGTYALKGSATVWNNIASSSVGTQNDFAPGLVGNTVLRMTNATLTTISGFAGGYAGQRLIVLATGAGNVDFTYIDSASVAANRLLLWATVGKTSIVGGSGSAEFIYDSATSRWYLIQHEQGAWITRTFAAGNYTAGAGTWVVASASRDAYYLHGKTLSFSIAASGTTNNSANTVGKILTPGGYSAVSGDVGNVYVAVNGGGGLSEGGFWQASANQILTARYGVAPIAAGTWSIFASGQFEIQ